LGCFPAVSTGITTWILMCSGRRYSPSWTVTLPTKALKGLGSSLKADYQAHKGILLVGDRGTGKTSLAKIGHSILLSIAVKSCCFNRHTQAVSGMSAYAMMPGNFSSGFVLVTVQCTADQSSTCCMDCSKSANCYPKGQAWLVLPMYTLAWPR